MDRNHRNFTKAQKRDIRKRSSFGVARRAKDLPALSSALALCMGMAKVPSKVILRLRGCTTKFPIKDMPKPSETLASVTSLAKI